MLEWLKRHAWKACKRLKRFGGSNPPLSAKVAASSQQTLAAAFFCALTCRKDDVSRRSLDFYAHAYLYIWKISRMLRYGQGIQTEPLAELPEIKTARFETSPICFKTCGACFSWKKVVVFQVLISQSA